MFDCHLHVTNGLDDYDLSFENANIIFNKISTYNEKSAEYSNYYHSLIFVLTENLEWYRKLIDQKKIVCLKIHSRIQQINQQKQNSVRNKLIELDRNIPIIYDAFYYGSDLEYQPSLSFLIKLIKTFPNRKFIVAHAGGYRVIEYFFHLRDFENVGYDLSFSLQYLADTSCRKDLKKLIKYTDSNLLFYGSDFPKASPSQQLNELYKICEELEMSNETLNGILKTNWLKFIGL